MVIAILPFTVDTVHIEIRDPFFPGERNLFFIFGVF